MPKADPASGTKACCRCDETLPLSAFHRSHRTADGLTYHCRACQSLALREQRIKARLTVRQIPETRRCPDCDTVKPQSEFHRRQASVDGLNNYCKPCMAIRSRRASLMARYGVTPEWFDETVAAQGGTCALAGCTATTKLVVDHDHNTGEVRGVICGNCNSGIGLLGDDADRVFAAFAYLVGSRRLTHAKETT